MANRLLSTEFNKIWNIFHPLACFVCACCFVCVCMLVCECVVNGSEYHFAYIFIRNNHLHRTKYTHIHVTEKTQAKEKETAQRDYEKWMVFIPIQSTIAYIYAHNRKSTLLFIVGFPWKSICVLKYGYFSHRNAYTHTWCERTTGSSAFFIDFASQYHRIWNILLLCKSKLIWLYSPRQNTYDWRVFAFFFVNAHQLSVCVCVCAMKSNRANLSGDTVLCQNKMTIYISFVLKPKLLPRYECSKTLHCIQILELISPARQFHVSQFSENRLMP